MNLHKKSSLDDKMNAALVAVFLALVPALWIDAGTAEAPGEAAASAQNVATARAAGDVTVVAAHVVAPAAE